MKRFYNKFLGKGEFFPVGNEKKTNSDFLRLKGKNKRKKRYY